MRIPTKNVIKSLLVGALATYALSGLSASLPPSCELDASRILLAPEKLEEAMPLGKLNAGESKAILEQRTVDAYALQLEETAARQAEGKQIKTSGSRTERQGKTLTIRPESGQQRCYFNHQVAELPGLEGNGESSFFTGSFGKTPYLRIDRFAMHDSPNVELIHARNGRTLSFHVGNDAAALSPDGKRLLVVHEARPAGFSIAMLGDDEPVIEIACAIPSLPGSDPRSFSTEIKGWESDSLFSLAFKPKSGAPAMAMRAMRRDGKWQFAVTDPLVFQFAGGMRCSHNVQLSRSAGTCSSSCAKAPVMNIAPALSYFAPLRNLLEWAGDEGGMGHAAEIATAKGAIAKLTAGLEHGDRKLARTRNEQGIAALRADDLPKAVQRFQSAHEADPVDVEVLNNLGYAEMLAGIGDPGRHLVSTLLLDPSRANAWANLGHLFARNQALPEAQACFALALRLSGNPDKTLQFLKDQAGKLNDAGLSRAVQQLLQQSWLDPLMAGSSSTDSSATLGSMRKAAQAGDAQAQNALGVRYNNGEGVAKDARQASEWFQRAATQGIAAAQYDLAYLYEKGEGVSRDFRQAALWYRKASDQGYAKAYANLGQLYENGLGVPKDDLQAMGWYRKGAEKGDAVAQLNLGIFYAEGRGVTRNDALASDWYRKAADQGLVQAQNNLGRMYDAGLGVPKDFREAVKWYRRAAEQGHRTALYNLGAMVVNGDGVARDEVIAAMLFERAAALGHSNAARERDQLLRKLSETQVAEVKRLAAQWKPGAALPMASQSGSVAR